MSNNKQLPRQELISIADTLYREKNPNETMCTPNSVYITVLEKWYPEFQQSEHTHNFYDWCILKK